LDIRNDSVEQKKVVNSMPMRRGLGLDPTPHKLIRLGGDKEKKNFPHFVSRNSTFTFDFHYYAKENSSIPRKEKYTKEPTQQFF